MVEQMYVFEPGERFITLAEDGDPHVCEVQANGRITLVAGSWDFNPPAVHPALLQPPVTSGDLDKNMCIASGRHVKTQRHSPMDCPVAAPPAPPPPDSGAAAHASEDEAAPQG